MGKRDSFEDPVVDAGRREALERVQEHPFEAQRVSKPGLEDQLELFALIGSKLEVPAPGGGAEQADESVRLAHDEQGPEGVVGERLSWQREAAGQAVGGDGSEDRVR